jgi:eukaryotic-like serine/threonine-protein kinase
MQNLERCAKCGSHLVSDATGGFCSACLLEKGLGFLTDRSPVALVAGQLFAGYELLEEIARGGMGVVYKARQISLGRIVALKMILGGHRASQNEVTRFLTEARAAAALQHPNIVAIHEVGQCDGEHFFVMDFVEGMTLDALVRQKPLSGVRAAEIVKLICEAVHFAHKRGILHRDLKPSNVIMAANGQPRLTDFGLARRLDSETQLTVTGQVLGSPSFMPPEQAAGNSAHADPASDIYSLGALLYFLLTGRPPFLAETIPQTLRLVAEANPVAPRLLVPDLHPDLETICLKCLEKEPLKRYATAIDLADELGRVVRGEPIRARPIGAGEKFWRWCRRNPALAGLGFSLFLALAIGLSGTTWQWRRAEWNAKSEFQQRLKADQEKELGRRRLVRVNVANGIQLVEQGDYLAALPWFTEALSLDSGHPREEEHHRARIAGVLDQSPRLVQNWFHQGPVRHAEFSPDGLFILTASLDNTARVWRLADGKQFALFQHPQGVEHAAFSPDSQRIVTACADGSIRLWDLSSPQAPSLVMEHDGRINHVAFDSEGRRIISASSDNTARIWDAVTGNPLTGPLKHGNKVVDARISPDGRRAASISADNTIRIWDTASGAQLHRGTAYSRFVFEINFSPDGNRLVAASWGKAMVIDPETGSEVLPPLTHLQGITSASFNSDGNWIVTSSEDQTVRVWDARTRREITTPLTHPHSVSQAKFSPDGKWVITACDDGAARIWNINTSEQAMPLLRQGSAVTKACFSPDGSYALTAGIDGSVRLWDLTTLGTDSFVFRHRDMVRNIGFSKDGAWLFTAGDDKTLQVWETAKGKAAGHPLKHNAKILDATFSADASMVLTASQDGSIRIWDRLSGDLRIPPLLETGIVVSARFNLAETKLVSVSGAKTIAKTASRDLTISKSPVCVRTWNALSGEPVTASITLEQSIDPIALSWDTLTIATACEDKYCRIWDTATGAAVMTLPATNGSPSHLRFSPDGKLLACSCTKNESSEVLIWDVSTGRQVCPPILLSRSVLALAFSPNSERIATAGSDGSARIWNAFTGQPVTPPLMHRWTVFAVQFSADGRRIVTGSGDHTARVWDSETGELICPPFHHNGYVHKVIFSPDGSQIVAAMAQSIDPSQLEKSARLWRLHIDARPIADLQTLAQILSSHRIDFTSSLVPLNSESLQMAWADYAQRYPFHGREPAKITLTNKRTSKLKPANLPPKPLFLEFTDAIGDAPPNVPDLSKLVMTFDASTGRYAIRLTADDAQLFHGYFRVNVNLYNRDRGTNCETSFFSDTVRDFRLESPTNKVVISGTNLKLQHWRAGDRVAACSGPFGNPSCTTRFATAVSTPSSKNYAEDLLGNFDEKNFSVIAPAEDSAR